MLPIEEFHPALVHFPLVFLLTGFALDAWLTVRGRDLAEGSCGADTALATLLVGVLSGGLAAVFGDIALDHAVHAGFPAAPIEGHEDFALSALGVFAIVAAVQALARWRRWRLVGARAWLLLVVGTVGVVLLLTAAYHGGELVYRLGVNVRAVGPR
ncbi:MAG: hypothetical protein HZB55_13875 [Deltaproteobacteria bacterium]|nr:hypothetical protein [Deltaproteobacteria bacterium]